MPNEFARIARITGFLGWPRLRKLSQALAGMRSLVMVARWRWLSVLARVGVGAYGERSEVRSRARQNMLPVTRAAQLLVPGITGALNRAAPS